MTQNLFKRTFSAAFAVATLVGASAIAADTFDLITGTTVIDFNTRKAENKDGAKVKAGIKDIYDYKAVRLSAYTPEANGKAARIDTYQFDGKIYRSPSSRKFKYLGEDASMKYDLEVRVVNPVDGKPSANRYGNIVGTMKQSADGLFDLSPVKAEDGSYTNGVSYTNQFATNPKVALNKDNLFKGSIQGKKGEGLEVKSRITKFINGQKFQYEKAKTDPMYFQSLTLAAGLTPGAFPAAVVNGSLIYDYETDTWNPNDVRFSYTLNNAAITETMLGTISWVEDPAYETNRKSSYQINVQFARQGDKEAPIAEIAAAENSEEPSLDELMKPDFSVPTILGTIEFDDSIGHNDDAGEWAPEKSVITWKVQATKTVTPQQAVNFFKLVGLVGVGPFFDE